MTAYWVVFAIMFLLQFIKVETSKGYLWRLVISFIPLFIFAAFRVNFGLDYEAYSEIFESVKSYSGAANELREEIGYLKLNEWLPTFRSLIIITSAFTCAAYIFFFYKIIPAKYSWLAVLLMFLAGDQAIFFMFSGIRNAISISILIFSIPLLQKRKLLPFIFCMLLASLFHKTAFIYFPMAYLVSSNKDMARSEMYIWCGVFVFFFIFSHTVIMDAVDNYVGALFEDRYDLYLQKLEDVGDNRGSLGKLAMVISFIPLVWFMYSGKFSEQENIVLRLGLMYVMATVMGGLNLRTTQHFILFFIASIIYLFSQCKNTFIRNGYLLFAIAYLSYAFFVIYMGSSIFPYEIYESTIFGIIE